MNKILLVEGEDDVHVMYHLFQIWEIPKEFEIRDCKGINNLQIMLRSACKDPSVTHIGAVIDADHEPEKRWRSLRDSLRNAELAQLPEQPDPAGTIVATGRGIKLGLWLMPNNTAAGMLEDFLRRLVPGDDPLMDYAEHIIDAVPDHPRRFKIIHRSKALIHTWLAWQEEPGKPFGLAVKNRSFAAEMPPAVPLASWVRDVFQLRAA